MLSKLKIENFRCFQSVEVDLKPLTVLIGANNTGKSSFLRAISCLENTRDNKFLGHDYFKLRNVRPSVKARHSDGRSSSRSFQVVRPSPIQHAQEMEVFEGESLSMGLFQLPSSGATCECAGMQPNQSNFLARDGSNLASVLDYLLRSSRRNFLNLLESLSKLIPGFEDLNIETPTADTRLLKVILDGGVSLRGDSLSTGVRHLICFATMVYHPNPPDIIMIEEPESGVHPKRLTDIVRLLREISNGKHGGRAAQVIVSTHSPFLLDAVDLTTDQVLVFRREKSIDGNRTVEAVDQARLKNFLQDFMLGEIWYNQEEDGLVSKTQ